MAGRARCGGVHLLLVGVAVTPRSIYMLTSSAVGEPPVRCLRQSGIPPGVYPQSPAPGTSRQRQPIAVAVIQILFVSIWRAETGR